LANPVKSPFVSGLISLPVKESWLNGLMASQAHFNTHICNTKLSQITYKLSHNAESAFVIFFPLLNIEFYILKISLNIPEDLSIYKQILICIRM